MRNEKGQFVKMREDITGQKFNRLTALNFSHKDKNRKTYWVFECECGNIKVLRTDQVKNGNTKSCGCLKKELEPKQLNRNGSEPTKYDSKGLSEHPLYSKWIGIKDRCYNVHSNRYKNYGGRGIKICNEWLYSFHAFYDWSIENGWQNGLEIDRINNNGNYEPSNCRYITRKENCNNRSTTRKIEINGEIHSITEWCEILGLNKHNILAHDKTDEQIKQILIEYLYANTEVNN